MKKITLCCSVLAAAALFIVGCNKKTNTAPEADKEFASSQDAAYATSIVTDLELICAYMGDRSMTNTNFLAPATAGAFTLINDTNNRTLTASWSGTVTCKDGKKRNGDIILTYSSVPVANDAKFYRQPFWVADVKLNNYWVDGWLVDDVTPFRITNKMGGAYNPASEPLTWTLDGDFTFVSSVDAAKNMSWKGSLTKTVTNSTNILVFNPNKLFPIAWTSSSLTPGANIEYKGTASGYTSANKTYSLAINDDSPLQRQYSCTPDKVLGVTSTTTTPITVLPVYSEWHPFVNGIVSFTTAGSTEPRLINFGGDGAAPCDNAGTVTIKGISYPIDFIK